MTSLVAHPDVWAAVQGIASPAITSLVYLLLPIIFRRLSVQAAVRLRLLENAMSWASCMHSSSLTI